MGDIGTEEEVIEVVPLREVDPREAPVQEPSPVTAPTPVPVPA